jgi:hypothetical protein
VRSQRRWQQIIEVGVAPQDGTGLGGIWLYEAANIGTLHRYNMRVRCGPNAGMKVWVHLRWVRTTIHFWQKRFLNFDFLVFHSPSTLSTSKNIWQVGPTWGVRQVRFRCEKFSIDFAPYSIDRKRIIFFELHNFFYFYRHSQHAHTHQYEYTHANPTLRSIFKDCAGKSSRLTKSPQAPRCRRERRLPLKAQTHVAYHWKHKHC